MLYVFIIVVLGILGSDRDVSTQEILAFSMDVNQSRCASPRQAIMEGEMVQFKSVLRATGVNLTVFWQYILFSEGDSIHDMVYYIGYIVLAKCDGKKGEDRPDRDMVAGTCWLDGDNIKTYLEIKVSVKYNASKVYIRCGPGLFLKSSRIAFPVVLQKAYMTLTVNSHNVKLRENALPLFPNSQNYIILCIINIRDPRIRATFSGAVYETYNDCLMHSITVTSLGIGLLYQIDVLETGTCERTISSILVAREASDIVEHPSKNDCRTIQSECNDLVWIILFVVTEFLKSQYISLAK